MDTIILLLVLGYFSTAVNTICMRVVGGNPTTIHEYPTTTAILFKGQTHPVHICGGSILNMRHILTAAHCFMVSTSIMINPKKYIIRVGSSLAHSGGKVHDIDNVIFHPDWNLATIDSDVAIMRTSSVIAYSNTVQPANIAGPNYRLKDNASIWAVGWGLTAENGNVSEQLRHVKVFNINRDMCRRRYERNILVTDNMLCSGWLGVGGRDQCTRDSGSPLFHNNVVVGLSSMGLGCARPCYPGINVHVARFSDWIKNTTKSDRNYHQTLNYQPSSTKIFFDWKSFIHLFE